MQEIKKNPPLWLSVIPLVILMVMLVSVVLAFGSDSLSGASQIALLVASASCITLGLLFKTMKWSDFEYEINRHIGDLGQAILILLLIGAVAGSWMISGVVPTMIYYGMQIISPQWFLVSTCVICAIVSVMTGSSWTTVATIGIALLGIGKAQGFHRYVRQASTLSQGPRLSRRLDCRRHHLGSLFRRQDVALERYHRSGSLNDQYSPL